MALSPAQKEALKKAVEASAKQRRKSEGEKARAQKERKARGKPPTKGGGSEAGEALRNLQREWKSMEKSRSPGQLREARSRALDAARRASLAMPNETLRSEVRKMEQSIREGNSGSWKVDSVRAAAKMHENAARGHEASASKGGSKSSKGEKLKQFAEQKGKTGEAAKKPKGKKAEQMQRAMQTGKKGGRFYVSKGGRKVYIGRRG